MNGFHELRSEFARERCLVIIGRQCLKWVFFVVNTDTALVLKRRSYIRIQLTLVNCRFGDAKACTSKDLGGVPDIVCMTEDGEARIVGDLKTPWAHDLESAMVNPDKRRTWLGLLTPRYT